MKLLKNRTVLGLLCIAAALLICFVLTPLLNAGMSKKTTIVRFTESVKAGEEVKKSMLQEIEVGAYNLPPDVLRSIAEAEGKYLTADVYAGDYLLAERYRRNPLRKSISLSLKRRKTGDLYYHQFFCGGTVRQIEERRHCVGDCPGLSWQWRNSDPGRIKVCGGHCSNGKVR